MLGAHGEQNTIQLLNGPQKLLITKNDMVESCLSIPVGPAPLHETILYEFQITSTSNFIGLEWLEGY